MSRGQYSGEAIPGGPKVYIDVFCDKHGLNRCKTCLGCGKCFVYATFSRNLDTQRCGRCRIYYHNNDNNNNHNHTEDYHDHDDVEAIYGTFFLFCIIFLFTLYRIAKSLGYIP